MTSETWAILGAIFGAGGAWTAQRFKIAKAQTDVNRIGGIARENDKKAERRWKHQLADEIEDLEPKDRSKRIADRIRQDAYRD